MKHLSSSVTETQKIARDFAKTLKPGVIVALYGDLGAGKTTFIQGAAKALGISKRVPSPSYILARDYDIPKMKGTTLYHIDLYRVESSEDLRSIDLQEIIQDQNNITLIEWAEKAKEVLPEKRIEIHMKDKGESQREITITS